MVYLLSLASGVAGPPGDRGAVGLKGEKGEQGFSVRGPPGFPGVKGQFFRIKQSTEGFMHKRLKTIIPCFVRSRTKGCSRSLRFTKLRYQRTGGSIRPPRDARPQGNTVTNSYIIRQ